MRDSWTSKISWGQLQCAFGDSREVEELLQEMLAGNDVLGDLINHVLHQGTIYEATIAVAACLVETLQTGKLGQRLIAAVNPATGEKYVLSEKALVFYLLSSMAESAHETVGSGSTPKNRTIKALLFEALRSGIPLYEAGSQDPNDQISEPSSALLEALAGGTMAAIDSQYRLTLGARLGMPLSPLNA